MKIPFECITVFSHFLTCTSLTPVIWLSSDRTDSVTACIENWGKGRQRIYKILFRNFYITYWIEICTRTDGQTDRNTHRQTDRQKDWQIEKETSKEMFYSHTSSLTVIHVFSSYLSNYLSEYHVQFFFLPFYSSPLTFKFQSFSNSYFI